MNGIKTQPAAELITSREADSSCSDSEERYRALFERSRDCIYVHDLKGRFLDANDAALLLSGYSRAEMLGLTVDEVILPEQLHTASAAMLEIVTQGSQNDDLVFQLKSKSGILYTLQGRGSLICRDGRPHSILSIARDITERQRADDEIRFRNVLLATQQDVSIDGILVVDEAGKIISFNRRFVEMWDIPSELIESRSDERFLQFGVEKLIEPERFLQGVKHLYEHRSENSRDEIALKDGRVFDRYSAPMTDADGRYYGRVWFFRDMTNRIRTEQALRESEQRFRTLFEQAADIIFLLEIQPEGLPIIRDANSAIFRILGYQPEEVINQPISVLEVDADAVEKRLTQMSNASVGKVYAFEAKHRCKDGAVRHFECSATEIRIGAKRFAITVERDVTERKLADDALRWSEERFQRVAETAKEWIWEVDPEGLYTYASPMVEQILGYRVEEVVGKKHFYDLVPPEDREALKVAALAAFAQKQPLHDMPNRNLHKNGAVVFLSTSGAPRLDDQGNLLSYFGVDTDITERTRAEETLRKSEETYRLHFANVHDVIFSLDKSGVFLSISPSIEKMLGYRPDELIGKSFLELNLLSPECIDRAVSNSLKVISGETISAVSYVFLAKDGSKHLGELSSSPIFVDGKIVGAAAVARDITERRRAEDELRFRNVLLATQQDVSIDGILVVDEAGKIISFNRRFVEMWNIPSEVIESKSDERTWQFVVEQLTEADRFRQRVKHLYDYQSETSRDEVALKDGRTFDLYSAPMTDADGRYYGRVWFFRDMTDRIHTEQALRESEARYRLISENITDLVGMCDAAGVFNFASPSYQTVLGYDPAWLIGRLLVSLVHPADQEQILRLIRGRVEGAARPAAATCRMRHHDGRYLWFLFAGRRLFDVRGNATGALFGASEITEQIKVHQALLESEQRFRTLFEQASDVILLMEIQPDGMPIIRDANSATFHTLGYDRDELIGKPISLLEADPNITELVKNRRQMAVSQGGAVFEIKHRCKSGATKDFECSVREIEIDAKFFFISIERDITERKRADEVRLQLEARGRHQQKLESIGTLAAGVAHEINNPLNAILNFAELIHDRANDGDRNREDAEKIITESKRVALIVRHLLAFARQDMDQHSPANMEDIINAVLSLITAVLRKDQIILSVNAPPDLPKLKCRSSQIQQVIMNLITNARDSLNQRYPGYDPDKVIRIDLGLIEHGEKTWLRTTVEDHGMGIPPEIVSRVFDPFFTTKPRGVGTGLGLSVSHGIVKEHRGEMSVEGQVGEYARFHIDLPFNNDWGVEEKQPPET